MENTKTTDTAASGANVAASTASANAPPSSSSAPSSATPSNPSQTAASSIQPNSSKPPSSSSSSSQSPHFTVLEALRQTALGKQVIALCLWRSPLASGLTLLSCFLLTFLFVRGYSLLTLVCYLLALQLATTILFVNGSKVALRIRGAGEEMDAALAHHGRRGGASSGTGGGKAGEKHGSETTEYISIETLVSLLPLIHSSINSLIDRSLFLLRCEDNRSSVQALVVLLALSVVGRVMDGVTLFGVSCCAAMSLPLLYQRNQKAFDEWYGRISRDFERILRGMLGKKSASGEGLSRSTGSTAEDEAASYHPVFMNNQPNARIKQKGA